MMIGKWVSVVSATGALFVASGAFAQHRGDSRGPVAVVHGRVRVPVVVVAPPVAFRPARPVVIARPPPIIIHEASVFRPVVRPVIVAAPGYYPEYAPPQPVYVAYRPAPPPEPTVEYRDRPAPYTAPYRSPNHMYNNQFGLNINAQSGVVGSGNATGLLGIGAALRFRPIPWVGIEGGISAYTGRDFNYDTRNEISGQGNIYGYINPQSPLQLYGVAGVTYTSARIGDGYGQPLTTNRYVGVQAGAGLELRFNRHFALNGDLRGVLRTRTDDDLLYVPGSRTSGGIMGSIGMTVYF